MSAALLLIGVALLVIPGLSRSAPRKLFPSESARLIALALSSGLLIVEAGLILIALPAFFGSRFDLIGMHTPYVLAHLPVGSPILALPAATFAVLIPTLAFCAARRMSRLRALVDVNNIGNVRTIAEHEVVVLPTATPVAFASHRASGRVVLSSGLIESLPIEELEAVVRHEAAHLTMQHQRLLALAHIVEQSVGRFVLGSRRSTDALRLSVERWADEVAATKQRRHHVRTAVSSVVAQVQTSIQPSIEIEERLRALSIAPATPTSKHRLVTYAPVIALSVIGLAYVGDGVRHAGVLAALML